MEVAEVADQHGEIVWRVYRALDVNAAVKYYTQIFGWEVARGGRYLVTSYVTCLADGIPVATFSKDSYEGKWMFCVLARNLDETVRRAEEMESSVEVHNSVLGRGGLVSDLDGRSMLVVDPAGAGPLLKRPPFGAFEWAQVGDVEPYELFDFYHALLGWEILDDLDMNAAGDRFLVIGKGSRAFGAIHQTPDEYTAYDWHHYVTVEDVDEAFSAALAGGGEALIFPSELPNGDLFAECIDPQGGVFGIREPAR